MKKIIEANIGGVNFSLEDDAYFMLKDYLGRFEASIPDKREAREVMEDVEARVAEIFQEKRSFSNQVINIQLVKTVIEHLGEIDEPSSNKYTESAENESADYSHSGSYNNEYTTNQGYTKGERFLFRDPDNKKIAGVCSGLAAYFNIDTTLVRVLFAVTAWVYGSALIVYIILWICLSEAKTVADKLKMRGWATTFENMRKFTTEHKQQNS